MKNLCVIGTGYVGLVGAAIKIAQDLRGVEADLICILTEWDEFKELDYPGLKSL